MTPPTSSFVVYRAVLAVPSDELSQERQMSENNSEFAKIITKAWRDPAFKAELIANPAAALKGEGIDVPAGMKVTVVENTDKLFHLVLPPAPTDELSDKELDAVAGGASPALAIFTSYLGATNAPGAFKLPAQSKIVAMEAYAKAMYQDILR